MARHKIRKKKENPLAVRIPREFQASDIIDKIFANVSNPAAFSNFENIYKEVKKLNPDIKRKDVRDALEDSFAYTKHKARRIRYRRLKTIPGGYMTDWQADLADFQKVPTHNNGYRYLLVCIDVLSRKVFVAPVKSKSPKDMINAFDHIFNTIEDLPQRLFTDKGLEFQAKEMKKYFEKNDILKYVAQSDDVKAAMAERTIRNIKNRLYKYFTHYRTHRWVDVVEQIVEGINNTVNRTTKMRPNDVNKENADDLWNRLYADKYVSNRKYRYKEGDYVRMQARRRDFEKGYLPNFTTEVFRIDQVKPGYAPNYRLVDSKGEEIIGKFYENEFSKTKAAPNEYFVVERILQERRRAGKPEYLVKWRGLPENVATWVRLDDI